MRCGNAGDRSVVGVQGDGKCNRPPGYRGLIPQEWPSIRETNGWQPGALSEASAKEAFRLLLNAGWIISGGRFCSMCSSDLGDRHAPRSSSPEGFKAATGHYPEWTLSIPQGGHAPDCVVPYLLRWCGEPESPLMRIRTHDIDDEQAKILAALKSPMELVSTDAALLTEAERKERDAVMQSYGYLPADPEVAS